MEDGRPRGLKAWWGAVFFGLQCIFNVLWSSHGLMAWEVAGQVRGRETLCPSSAKSLPSQPPLVYKHPLSFTSGEYSEGITGNT